MKRLFSLPRSFIYYSCLSSHVLFFWLCRISLSLSSAYPHILPRVLAAFTITIMNVEDTELFMAPQSASKTWPGRCMWAFEDGSGPALRYGEDVDLISERSVRAKFQALLSKKDGSYSYSRQHSLLRLSHTHTSLIRPI